MDIQDVLDFVYDELSAGGIVNLELEDEVILRNVDRTLRYMTDFFVIPMYKTFSVAGATDATAQNFIPLSLPKSEDPDGTKSIDPYDSDIERRPRKPTIERVIPSSNIINLDLALVGINSSMAISTLGDVGSRTSNYAIMIQKLSQLESILGRGAKVVNDKLFVDKYYGDVTVVYLPEKLEVGQINEGYWQRFLIEYTTALCKRQMAQSRGKFVVSSNNISTNAEQLLTQANETIAKLEEEIQNHMFVLTSR